MGDGAYRSELEAAQARIAHLEGELALRDSDPKAVRLAALTRERDIVATLAMPNLTRLQSWLSNTTFIAFAAMAATLGMVGIWSFAGLCAAVAVGVRIVFTRTAQTRAATYARRLAAIDTQILALETPREAKPASEATTT